MGDEEGPLLRDPEKPLLFRRDNAGPDGPMGCPFPNFSSTRQICRIKSETAHFDAAFSSVFSAISPVLRAFGGPGHMHSWVPIPPQAGCAVNGRDLGNIFLNGASSFLSLCTIIPA